MKNPSRHPFAPALVLAILALGVGGACSPQGAVGDAGHACYPNATCNGHLVCEAGTCVTSGGTGGSASSSVATGGTGGHATGSTGGAGTTSTGPATTGSTSASGSGGAKNGPPVFLSFGTSVTSLTEGQTVTFTAVLTDPDGINDVIGGTLVDQFGGTYGAFVTSAQEGAYSLAVTWDQVNQMMSVDFAYGATDQRTFTATFFDQGGNSVQKTVPLTLTCKGHAACAGACVDTMADTQNCSTCGHVCPAGGECAQGKCGSFTGCLPKGIVSTCNAYCLAHGQTCLVACPGSGGTLTGGVAYPALACNSGTIINETCAQDYSMFTSTRCCCG